ncbi:MAG TPA: tyrosine--tRNA ligase [Candidatus Acidoferrum sp.]|nr:tyrosine--tRNA ligase [Candidatus Acidoferrum sp.]
MATALRDDFEARGLIAGASEGWSEHLATGSRTIYVGFDPTADSLHIGSLLPLLALRRAQLAGHRPIVLVGGGTGLIGDPSGKSGERALNPKDVVHEWAERLKRQVAPFLDFDDGRLSAVLADNYEWISELDVLSLLRDIGKHFAVGVMLAKESVKARLQTGISYTEFSYQVLQAYDFLCLLRRYGCTVQMGGSDQWGNITAGIDLIRRVEGRAAFGLTLPLVTKNDGGKFGKTESGTIWLDPKRTSAYEMYQFWLNTTDRDVAGFLKYFTFLSLESIEGLAESTQTSPERREAQRALAREVTALVHGQEGAREAEAASSALFSGRATEGPPAGAAPGAVFPPEARAWPLWKLLASVVEQTGGRMSTSEARRLIQQGGVEVDGSRASGIDQTTPSGCHTVRVGKRRIYRVIVEDADPRFSR